MGGGDGRVEVGHRLAFPPAQGGEGAARALPALIAVHGPVAPLQAGNFHVRVVPAEGPEIVAQGGRRHVPAIGEGVHPHVQPVSAEQAGELAQMVLMRMDPTGGEQPEQVHAPGACLGLGHKVEDSAVFGSLAAGKGGGNPGQGLHHHPARSDVEMADFGIADLPLGQPDIGSAGGEARGRKPFHHGIEVRGAGQRRCVECRLAPDAPAIENDQSDGRLGHGAGSCKGREGLGLLTLLIRDDRGGREGSFLRGKSARAAGRAPAGAARSAARTESGGPRARAHRQTGRRHHR